MGRGRPERLRHGDDNRARQRPAVVPRARLAVRPWRCRCVEAKWMLLSFRLISDNLGADAPAVRNERPSTTGAWHALARTGGNLSVPEGRDAEVHDDENQAKADRKQQPSDRRPATRTTTGCKTQGANKADQQPKLDQSPRTLVAERCQDRVQARHYRPPLTRRQPAAYRGDRKLRRSSTLGSAPRGQQGASTSSRFS